VCSVHGSAQAIGSMIDEVVTVCKEFVSMEPNEDDEDVDEVLRIK
jgi:hypothetical protein